MELFGAGLVWLVATAWGQEPVGPGALPSEPVQNFDSMMVTTVLPEAGAAPEDAARIEALLRERFAQSNAITPMSDVPFFEAQGYDAVAYMNACPDGQYAGCALVIGQRAPVDWVVGATVMMVEDTFDPTVVQERVKVHFVDVLGSDVVASFTVLLDGTNDAQVVDGIAKAYDQMVEGAFDNKDLRENRGDPEAQAAVRRMQADAVAAALAELEVAIGDVVRGDIIRNVEPSKVTKAQLDAIDDREEVAPWERVGMLKGEYRRFANSGKDLKTWRTEKNGRFGQVLLRAAAGGGTGPYSQRYVSQILLDGVTLVPKHSVQLNEVSAGSGGAFDLEAGLGVAPWVEVMVAIGFRTGKVNTLIDEDVDGQVAIPSGEGSQSLNTTQLGVRAAFVPFTHSVVRPVAGLGLGAWSGKAVAGSARQDPLPKPTSLFLELLPGAEVSASNNINLFARALIAVPVAGNTAAFEETGSGMENPPTAASGVSKTGFAVQAGLTVRLGPLWTYDNKARARIVFEDEP